MLRRMDSSKPSSASGHLAENIDYLMGQSTDYMAISVYGKTTVRRGGGQHAPIHDALRATLLMTTETEITAHIGDIAYAATRFGDDQCVACWRTGSPVAKSRVRAFKRAAKRKVAKTSHFLPGKEIAA